MLKRAVQKRFFSSAFHYEDGTVLRTLDLMLARPLRLELVKNHIEHEKTDAIVCSSNSHMTFHKNGDIFRIAQNAGADQFEEYTKRLFEQRKGELLKVGEAVSMPATGLLGCKFVIHVVPPIYHDGHHNEEQLLKQGVLAALIEADKKRLRSIAFPALSADSFNQMPKYVVAKVMLQTFEHDYAQMTHEKSLQVIRIAEHGWVTLGVFTSAFDDRNMYYQAQKSIKNAQAL